MADIHCLAESLIDRGDMLQAMVEHGDGKLTNYVQGITDTALGETKLLSPDVLIISGDLSLQGEKENHGELAKKLDEVEKVGVAVLTIPGNHDISNPSAFVYSGGDRYLAESTTPEDSERIYKKFGYSEVSSKDTSSLSYTYDLGPSMRLLMLDTCQYGPRDKIGGVIKTETYERIREQLEQAAWGSVVSLSMAHHNLLEGSEVYADDCTIEHSRELIQVLEGENIPLFLSGHLYMQYFTRDNNIGIYEVAISPLSMPLCRCGVLGYMEDETFYYYTRKVNMEKRARRNKSADENLLNFDTYSPSTLKQIFYNQTHDAVKNFVEERMGSIFMKLTESEKQQMAEVRGDINATCCGDRVYEVVKKAVKQPGYSIWKEHYYPSILYEYLECAIEDAVWDYSALNIE